MIRPAEKHLTNHELEQQVLSYGADTYATWHLAYCERCGERVAALRRERTEGADVRLPAGGATAMLDFQKQLLQSRSPSVARAKELLEAAEQEAIRGEKREVCVSRCEAAFAELSPLPLDPAGGPLRLEAQLHAKALRDLERLLLKYDEHSDDYSKQCVCVAALGFKARAEYSQSHIYLRWVAAELNALIQKRIDEQSQPTLTHADRAVIGRALNSLVPTGWAWNKYHEARGRIDITLVVPTLIRLDELWEKDAWSGASVALVLDICRLRDLSKVDRRDITKGLPRPLPFDESMLDACLAWRD